MNRTNPVATTNRTILVVAILCCVAAAVGGAYSWFAGPSRPSA